MFEKAIYDQYHVERDTSVALTVFAVGRSVFHKLLLFSCLHVYRLVWATEREQSPLTVISFTNNCPVELLLCVKQIQ